MFKKIILFSVSGLIPPLLLYADYQLGGRGNGFSSIIMLLYILLFVSVVFYVFKVFFEGVLEIGGYKQLAMAILLSAWSISLLVLIHKYVYLPAVFTCKKFSVLAGEYAYEIEKFYLENGRYPVDLEESNIFPERSKYGPWKYSSTDTSFALVVGDYVIDDLEYSYTKENGSFCDI